MADIKQRARELLAAEWVRDSHNFTARLIRDGQLDGPQISIGGTRDMDRAIRAIVAALASQPQAPAAAALDLERAIDIMWTWQSALGGHVYDGRDVARTLTAPVMESIGVNPDVLIGVDRREPAIVIAKREIIRALLAAAPAPEVSGE